MSLIFEDVLQLWDNRKVKRNQKMTPRFKIDIFSSSESFQSVRIPAKRSTEKQKTHWNEMKHKKVKPQLILNRIKFLSDSKKRFPKHFILSRFFWVFCWKPKTTEMEAFVQIQTYSFWNRLGCGLLVLNSDFFSWFTHQAGWDHILGKELVGWLYSLATTRS